VWKKLTTTLLLLLLLLLMPLLCGQSSATPGIKHSLLSCGCQRVLCVHLSKVSVCCLEISSKHLPGALATEAVFFTDWTILLCCVCHCRALLSPALLCSV
jgi:hypothetical protein